MGVIALDYPPDAHPACIGTNWERLPDGSVRAWYASRRELFWALAAVLPEDRWRRLESELKRREWLDAEARELRGLG